MNQVINKEKAAEVRKELGDGLRTMRKKSRGNYTQAQVAAAIGISRNHYNSMEAGTTGITPEYLYALAQFYDCDILMFFPGPGIVDLELRTPPAATQGARHAKKASTKRK